MNSKDPSVGTGEVTADAERGALALVSEDRPERSGILQQLGIFEAAARAQQNSTDDASPEQLQ